MAYHVSNQMDDSTHQKVNWSVVYAVPSSGFNFLAGTAKNHKIVNQGTAKPHLLVHLIW